MIPEAKLAEYYALAKVLGFQQSFIAFKTQFMKYYTEATS